MNLRHKHACAHTVTGVSARRTCIPFPRGSPSTKTDHALIRIRLVRQEHLAEPRSEVYSIEARVGFLFVH